MSNSIITPHGEKLCNLMQDEKYLNKFNKDILQLKSWTLSDRQLCDIEMILNGGFSPLDGFMNRKDYNSVCEKMRLENNLLWPIPITLDINDELVDTLEINEEIALRDKEGFVIAILTINDIWTPDKEKEAQQIYQTTDIFHPGVNTLLNETHSTYVGGTLKGIHYPKHYDYPQLRHTPQELRESFDNWGWKDIIAFQTRNPMHRAHIELTKRALNEKNAKLLIHPVVGLTKPGDVNHYTRVRCYKHIMNKYPKNMAALSLLPLAMRMAGPKEALWHAIIRKNYGCNYFIVGRDHASPGLNKDNTPFYGPYDAQEMLNTNTNELGIKMIPFKQLVYVKEKKSFIGVDEVPKDLTALTVSGTELRKLLDEGKEIPEWFSYPEVISELQKQRPSLSNRGFTIFFTGLSGSGKSTLANGLLVKLLEEGRRPVSLLDGDIVRTHLSSELGFSKEHRSLNVRRIGFVASEITKNGGIAICAPIAPYRLDRQFNRNMIDPLGGYIEIFVNTPLEVCEQRDAKGLYAKARKGILKQFTGIDDPYEKPRNAEIVINSSNDKPETLVDQILHQIHKMGY